jgi:putative FmdB family regulatory protein
MPTYEYACTQCGRRVEVVQSFSDAPLETCETCGGRLRRVFHPVGVLFKGSGFYSTDARGGRGASSRDGDRGKSKESSESKSESSSNKEGSSSNKEGASSSPGSSNKKGSSSS